MTRRLIINGRFLGGAETAVNGVARDLTRALIRAPGDWQIELAVPPTLANAAEAFGCPLRVTGRGDGPLWDQFHLPRLRRAGVIAGFFNTVPMPGRGHVTLLHDAHVFTTPQSYGRATGAWRRLLARRAGARGNYVLTVSAHARASLLVQGIGTEDRIGVVPNGPGAAGRVVPDHGVIDRLGLETAFCLGLASLLPHKNIPLLLRVFADPRLADLTLVLVGTAGAADFARAGHAVPRNVRFAGRVSDAELAALYARALAICMPSTQEGFGLPVLEGMRAGTPAVIAPHGALPEVAGAAGLRAFGAEDWVTAIRRLADDPGLHARLSARARARASAFTWEGAAARVLTHLDRWFDAAGQPRRIGEEQQAAAHHLLP